MWSGVDKKMCIMLFKMCVRVELHTGRKSLILQNLINALLSPSYAVMFSYCHRSSVALSPKSLQACSFHSQTHPCTVVCIPKRCPLDDLHSPY